MVLGVIKDNLNALTMAQRRLNTNICWNLHIKCLVLLKHDLDFTDATMNNGRDTHESIRLNLKVKTVGFILLIHQEATLDFECSPFTLQIVELCWIYLTLLINLL